MSDENIAGSYGAVDLSAAHANAPVATSANGGSTSAGAVGGATISASLIADVTETNFEEITGLSQTVPVVLVFYSGRSIVSQQALEVLEDQARDFAGAFCLGKIDVDTQAVLAQALQVQSLPTCIALVARQPVPMFEGVPSADDFRAVMTQLLQVAPQLGVTGRIAVDDEQLEKPMPAAHEAPRAAEEAGDWEKAIALWKKVLANNPADHEAQLALTRAEFEARQDAPDAGDPLAAADQLFARGQEVEAFDLLLNQVADPADADAKEAARARLVELFALGTDPAAVKKARMRLSTMLMV